MSPIMGKFYHTELSQFCWKLTMYLVDFQGVDNVNGSHHARTPKSLARLHPLMDYLSQWLSVQPSDWSITEKPPSYWSTLSELQCQQTFVIAAPWDQIIKCPAQNQDDERRKESVKIEKPAFCQAHVQVQPNSIQNTDLDHELTFNFVCHTFFNSPGVVECFQSTNTPFIIYSNLPINSLEVYTKERGLTDLFHLKMTDLFIAFHEVRVWVIQVMDCNVLNLLVLVLSKWIPSDDDAIWNKYNEWLYP